MMVSTHTRWGGTWLHLSASVTMASASIRPNPYRWLTACEWIREWTDGWEGELMNRWMKPLDSVVRSSLNSTQTVAYTVYYITCYVITYTLQVHTVLHSYIHVHTYTIHIHTHTYELIHCVIECKHRTICIPQYIISLAVLWNQTWKVSSYRFFYWYLDNKKVFLKKVGRLDYTIMPSSIGLPVRSTQVTSPWCLHNDVLHVPPGQ